MLIPGTPSALDIEEVRKGANEGEAHFCVADVYQVLRHGGSVYSGLCPWPAGAAGVVPRCPLF